MEPRPQRWGEVGVVIGGVVKGRGYRCSGTVAQANGALCGRGYVLWAGLEA